MNTEIIKNMPFDEYLALPRMSSSALKNMDVCPAFYKWRLTNPMKRTDAMALGTMIHTWMLENHRFQREYYVVPSLSRKSKQEKETYQIYLDAANDRELITDETMNKYKVLPNRTDTENEVTVLFEMKGVPCKARFDMLHRNDGAPKGVEDLKTIANIDNIDRDFVKFKYYIQAGFYSEAYRAAFGEWPEFFNFTFVNTGEFLDMITCEAEFDYVEFGRMKCAELLEEYKNCLVTDKWKARDGFTIRRPQWM